MVGAAAGGFGLASLLASLLPLSSSSPLFSAPLFSLGYAAARTVLPACSYALYYSIVPHSQNRIRDAGIAGAVSGAALSSLFWLFRFTKAPFPFVFLSGSSLGLSLMLYETLKTRAGLPSTAATRHWRHTGVWSHL